MAVIETWLKTDLKSIVRVNAIHGNVFSQDNMANLIGVELLDGGAPADVAGSVSANVLRADGTTVAVDGTLSGNRASVTLPQAAYAVPGMLAVVIKLTVESTVTTIGAVQAIVYRSSTDTIIDPGTIIPSIQNLIADIDEAVDSIPVDYSALNSALECIPGIKFFAYEPGYINCSGTQIDITSVTASNDYAHVIVECSPGDIFVVQGIGAGSAKKWCFVSSTGARRTYGNGTDNNSAEVIMAPTNTAYLIAHKRISQSTSPFVIKYTSDMIQTDYKKVGFIPSGTDFDTLVTPGTRYVLDASSAATMSHIPSTIAGRLIVLTVNGPSSIHQWYIDSEGVWYTREKTGDNWKGWKTFGTELNGSTITVIPDGADVDDYKSPGSFRVATVASASTISNLPVAFGGRLTVMTLNSANSVHQWYIDSEGNWFTRELIRGVWKPWMRLIATSDLDSDSNALSGLSAYNNIHVLQQQADYNIAFANAFIPLKLTNYLGNKQNVHPKVLYFANKFGGHAYWMAYTPYPYSNDDHENPCIAYSDDGYKWTNIAGNPIDDPQGFGYNSDTHLVYNSVTEKLECWFRYVGDASEEVRDEIIYRKMSSDGITWGEKEALYTNSSGQYAKFLSPAVLFDGTTYHIWVVFGSGAARIDYYTAPASNITSWTFVRSFNITFTDGGTSVAPWHLDVIMDGDTFVMLVMCRNSTSVSTAKCSLFITTSSDNITYTTPVKVVGGGGWDKYMYRSSIVKVGSKYRIYYSAGSGGTVTIYNKAVWGLGITESDSLTTGYYGAYE